MCISSLCGCGGGGEGGNKDGENLNLVYISCY